jgi:dTMP kinase
MSRGRLIALEGIDGAGKSTLQRALARRFRAEGRSVTLRREPADPELGRRAQELGRDDPLTGALLFTLDRARSRGPLLRAIGRGAIVLQDRSFYSTLAYQGSALPPPWRLEVERLQRLATVPPDRVLFLDLPPEQALARARGRGQRLAPFEKLRILARVRAAYRKLARRPGWIRLDATLPPEELADRAARALRGALGPAARRRGGRRSFTPGRKSG